MLLRPLATIVEVLVQANILNWVPAHANAKSEAPARQNVERCCLFGDQRGLPLRQDHDLGRELDPIRASAQETEHHEWVMEEVLRGVSRTPVWTACHVDAEHMVGSAEMIVAERLGSLCEITHRCRVALDINQWQRDAELHRGSPSEMRKLSCRFHYSCQRFLVPRHRNPSASREAEQAIWYQVPGTGTMCLTSSQLLKTWPPACFCLRKSNDQVPSTMLGTYSWYQLGAPPWRPPLPGSGVGTRWLPSSRNDCASSRWPP